MKLKTVMKVIVCLSVALFFLIGTARADKRYQIMISAVTKAGAVELQPGEYTIIVDNSAARFANSKTGKEFEVAAKIDDSAKTKFAGPRCIPSASRVQVPNGGLPYPLFQRSIEEPHRQC